MSRIMDETNYDSTKLLNLLSECEKEVIKINKSLDIILEE